MDKKNFPQIPTGSGLQEIPPRLVKAQQGWFFVFYVPLEPGGEPKRDRKSYNLNRIHDKRRRREQAEKILDILEELLPLGYPWVGKVREYDFAKFSRLIARVGQEVESIPERTVEEAINQIVAMKLRNTTKKDTDRTYSSRAKLFLEFLRRKKLNNLPLSRLTFQHVQDYLDEVRLRVSNTTYENYRKQTSGFFHEMVRKEWIEKNPFAKAEKLKRGKKKRRPFSPDEAMLTLRCAFENDWWLFVLMLLHLGGWLRRTECYRLRFRDFHLQEGFIEVSDEVSKNGKEATVTIPAEVLFFLRDERFAKNPKGHLIFGSHCLPHPTKTAGESTWKTKHREMLLWLHKAGELGDIAGLSLYSWKDTGVSILARQLQPIDLRDHARHASLDQTMTYYQAPKISAAVQQVSFGLFDEIIATEKEKKVRQLPAAP